MITVFISADAPARDSEFLRQRHAFMTLSAALGRQRYRRGPGALIERHLDIVDAMTVCARWRAGYSPGHGLSMNALNKLVRFSLMTLTTGGGDVDFGNR